MEKYSVALESRTGPSDVDLNSRTFYQLHNLMYIIKTSIFHLFLGKMHFRICLRG